MNLLYTITSYHPAIGGAQTHVHELARRLTARHAVRVLCHWNRYRTDWLLGTTLLAPRRDLEYDADGVAALRFGVPLWRRPFQLPWVLGYYGAMDWSIDRLSKHMFETILGKVGEVGVDVVHNARIGREPLSFASLKLARHFDVPFLLTPFHHPRWVGWRYRPYLRLYRMADRVICLTEAERRTLEELGVDPARLRVLGMGPNVADSADPSRLKRIEKLRGIEKIVLFVGQKYRYKGVDLLLEAAPRVWRSHPKTAFVFVGPPSRWSRRLFRRPLDARIVDLGAVDNQQKTDALAAADVLCLPSTQESFGAVFLEAWSFHKPVIGCPIPAVSEIIEHGENGLLSRPEPEELARSIVMVLDDPELGRRLGDAGHRLVRERWTWSALAARLDAIYEEVKSSG